MRAKQKRNVSEDMTTEKKKKKRDMQVEKGSDKQCFILRQRLCKTERKAFAKTALETHSNDVIIALSAPTGLWDR